MKNTELNIKSALLLLLHDKHKKESRYIHPRGLTFYQWLLHKELISKIEYDRLWKEENEDNLKKIEELL